MCTAGGKWRGDDAVVVEIGNIYIALRIIYFQSLVGVGMKGRNDDIGRERYVFARWTETVIYT